MARPPRNAPPAPRHEVEEIEETESDTETAVPATPRNRRRARAPEEVFAQHIDVAIPKQYIGRLKLISINAQAEGALPAVTGRQSDAVALVQHRVNELIAELLDVDASDYAAEVFAARQAEIEARDV